MQAEFPSSILSARPPGVWRFREALPIAHDAIPVTLGEFQTPLVEVLAAPCRVLLKRDSDLPTGSFKDRGASVLITQARELGVSFVVEDSSGNAGSAIAAYATAAAMRARIFVPTNAAPAKAALIESYGAELVRVPGTRADTAQAAWMEAQRAYYASHVWNPYFLQGTKTVAFEIWEQMGHTAPDWVITPVGHGTMLLGLAIGFRQLREAGLLDKLPRIVGAQATACAPLVHTARSGGNELIRIIAEPTQADGIAIDRPVRWRQILAAVRECDGQMVDVTEDAIRSAHLQWSSRGWAMEPTSATAFAALAKLSAMHFFEATDTVVIPVTGSHTKAVKRFSGEGT